MSQHFASWIRAALVIVLTAGSAYAQTATISGRVTEAQTGEGIPNANVLLLDTAFGVATSIDGSFTIPNVPAGTYTIRATHVAYIAQSQEVTVAAGESMTINFVLAEPELEGIFVTGYRVTTVPIESGAISVVDGAQLENLTVRSPDQALQGRAAGVRVTSASGQPGAGVEIQVRGAGSISAGSSPLFIVDGIQMSRGGTLFTAYGNPLTAIATDDIESIEILKDAAAASIYGAQAANGVVIITTRRGRAGATEINFESQIGAVSEMPGFRVMNAEEYVQFRVDGYINRNAWARPSVPQAVIDAAHAQFGNPDTMGVGTDWYDLVFRTGLTQTYNLSFRGGSDRTSFFASGSYANDEGTVIGSTFQRLGMRLNLDHRVSDRLQFESRVSLSSSSVDGTIADGAWINGPFFAAQFLPPTISPWLDPDDPNSGYNYNLGGTFTFNPLAQIEYDTRASNMVSVIASGAINFQVMDGLFARTFAGIRYTDGQEEDYRDPRQPPNFATSGSMRAYGSRRTEYNVSQTFTYSTLLSDIHRISSMAGVEIKEYVDETFSAGRQGFPNHLFRTLGAGATNVVSTQTHSAYSQVSFFGDAEYSYEDTYQLRGVLRYDGSSRFGANRRFGLFGTIAGYVRPLKALNTEVDFLSDLKLRAGYGTTGNSEIGNFAARQLWGVVGVYAGGSGLAPLGANLGNTDLTWEASNELNIGLDYGLFSNRILGSIEAYTQTRDKLLLQRTLPSDSGFPFITENIGEVTAQGIEFSFNTVNLDVAGFRWVTDFNIAFQRTEVISLIGDEDSYQAPNGLIYEIGLPVGQMQRSRFIGINPANGQPLFYDEDGNLTTDASMAPWELTGNDQPDYFGGFGNTFSYSGVTLEVFFQYDYGRKVFNNDRWFAETESFSFNKGQNLLDRWRQPGDIVRYPAALSGASWPDGSSAAGAVDQVFLSTRWQEDASYIRLKQIRLAYALPSEWIAPSGLRSASLFVQGENLVTWTNYTGIDPEIVGTGIGVYPQARVFTAGFRVGL